MHQRRPVAETAELRPQRDVVDVDLVEHEPEGAEPGDRTVRRADDVDVADGAVLQLPGVHLARPGTGERFALDLEDAVEIRLAFQQVDAKRREDVHKSGLPRSLPSSASLRRTYIGRIACGGGRWPFLYSMVASIAITAASSGTVGSASRAACPSRESIGSRYVSAPSPMNVMSLAMRV